MALTEACGHHCGIRSQAEGQRTWEGHCPCPECHDGLIVNDPEQPGYKMGVWVPAPGEVP